MTDFFGFFGPLENSDYVAWQRDFMFKRVRLGLVIAAASVCY